MPWRTASTTGRRRPTKAEFTLAADSSDDLDVDHEFAEPPGATASPFRLRIPANRGTR